MARMLCEESKKATISEWNIEKEKQKEKSSTNHKKEKRKIYCNNEMTAFEE